jgi:hypothetical protein
MYNIYLKNMTKEKSYESNYDKIFKKIIEMEKKTI